MKLRFSLIAVLLVSCSDPLDVDFGSGPLIQTDASTYDLTQNGTLLQVSIPISFENRLPQAIYLQRCSGVALPILERKDGNEWKVEWSPRDICPTTGPIRLDPGALYLDILKTHRCCSGGPEGQEESLSKRACRAQPFP